MTFLLLSARAPLPDLQSATRAQRQRLATRMIHAHIENCRVMLAQLSSDEREQFCRLAAQIAGSHPVENESWELCVRAAV